MKDKDQEKLWEAYVGERLDPNMPPSDDDHEHFGDKSKIPKSPHEKWKEKNKDKPGLAYPGDKATPKELDKDKPKEEGMSDSEWANHPSNRPPPPEEMMGSGERETRRTDAELVHAAHQANVEEVIVLDGEGLLANREEVVRAIKDVELNKDKDESRVWPDDPRGPVN